MTEPVDKKRKKNVFSPKSKKDRVFEDVTNIERPESEQTHSLNTPTKSALKHKKKKVLEQELLAMIERLNGMEDIQIQYNTELTTAREELDKVTKERDALRTQNKQLEERVGELKKELDRFVNKKMQGFLWN